MDTNYDIKGLLQLVTNLPTVTIIDFTRNFVSQESQPPQIRTSMNDLGLPITS